MSRDEDPDDIIVGGLLLIAAFALICAFIKLADIAYEVMRSWLA